MAYDNSISKTKRLFDKVIAGSVLVLFSPALLIIALLIRFQSPGPIFFVSKRVGRGYKIFNLYKFRTMEVGGERKLGRLKDRNFYKNPQRKKTITSCSECEKQKKSCSVLLNYDKKVICERVYTEIREDRDNDVFVKIADDPRITSLGNFLRRTSLDEVPQLYNVLKGDMSLVGNRPLPLYEAEKLTTDQAAERFLAPAGLTGLWQVTRHTRKDLSQQERMELDNHYSRTCSFWIDLKILWKTLPAVLRNE